MSNHFLVSSSNPGPEISSQAKDSSRTWGSTQVTFLKTHMQNALSAHQDSENLFENLLAQTLTVGSQVEALLICLGESLSRPLRGVNDQIQSLLDFHVSGPPKTASLPQTSHDVP